MDIAKGRADLVALLRAARQELADATTDQSALEDAVLESGPLVIGDGPNEEMKQTLGGVRRDLENAITAIRSALAGYQQLESVAQRYDAAGVIHPIKSPKAAAKDEDK